mgnify:CR=1 FL=1
MERVTQKVLNNAIERFNTMECLKGKEVYENAYNNKPRLFLNDKKTNSSIFIFEGTKSQCCNFLLSLSTFLISNGMGNK